MPRQPHRWAEAVVVVVEKGDGLVYGREVAFVIKPVSAKDALTGCFPYVP